MRILAIEREMPIPGHSNLADLLREEARGVWDLTKLGIVRESWTVSPAGRAVLMLECTDTAQARQHLAGLPLVRYQLVDFTLMELRNYDGYEQLFGSAVKPGPDKPEEPPEY